MRTIKFRAWNKNTKRMIDWQEILNEWTELKWVFDDPVMELMQFTGLTDKNGKEIYEGDIVRLNYHYDSYGRNETNELRNYVVEWWNKAGSWSLKESGKTFDEVTKGEVMGNIYENPDLI